MLIMKVYGNIPAQEYTSWTHTTTFPLWWTWIRKHNIESDLIHFGLLCHGFFRQSAPIIISIWTDFWTECFSVLLILSDKHEKYKKLGKLHKDMYSMTNDFDLYLYCSLFKTWFSGWAFKLKFNFDQWSDCFHISFTKIVLNIFFFFYI